MFGRMENYSQRTFWTRFRQGIREEARTLVNTGKSGPKSRFLIFAQERTGSSLLSRLLSTSPNVQCDREIFYYPRLMPFSFAENRARMFETQAYGFKVKIYQIRSLARKEPNAFLDHFENKGYRIIYLRRENLALHAFSNVFAMKVQKYHFASGEDRRDVRFDVDPEMFLRICRDRIAWQAREEDCLAGRTCLRLVYEHDLLRDYHGLCETARRISEYVGVPIDLGAVPIRKSVDREPAAFINNLDEVQKALSQSEFAHLVGALGERSPESDLG